MGWVILWALTLLVAVAGWARTAVLARKLDRLRAFQNASGKWPERMPAAVEGTAEGTRVYFHNTNTPPINVGQGETLWWHQ